MLVVLVELQAVGVVQVVLLVVAPLVLVAQLVVAVVAQAGM